MFFFIIVLLVPPQLYIYVDNKNFSIVHNTQVSHNITQTTPSYNFPARGKTKEFQVGRKLYAIHWVHRVYICEMRILQCYNHID